MSNNQMIFPNRQDFRVWLAEHGTTEDGFWLVFSKCATLQTLKPDEALEEALCFGWIDGQISRLDDDRYMKYFARRRKGSVWSAKNRQIVTDLEARDLMTEQGRIAIEQAKQAGIWDSPKPGPITDEQIAILADLLVGNEPACANFTAMPRSVRKTYTGLYLDAKSADARARRLTRIIDRLDKNLKPM